MRRRVRSQGGFTLVEVMVTLAISAIVMSALTSVILTSVRASDVATSRVEASAQIRTFQYFAYDDFARSNVWNVTGCTVSAPCTTQAIVLNGIQASTPSPPALKPYQVSYAWDGANFLDRQDLITGSKIHAATNVTAFSWYVDNTGPFPTVVVSLTVTVQNYVESQTFLFYPRMNP